MNRPSNLTQAAVVLNRLPRKQAASLLSRLELSDIKTVLNAAKSLDKASVSEMSEAMARFRDEIERFRITNFDSDDAAFGEAKRSPAMSLAKPRRVFETQVELAKPFELLIDAMPMIRVRVLEDEPPKNIAIVLSMLPPEIASTTMKFLDDGLRSSVLKSFGDLDGIHEDEVVQLSFALKLRLKKLNKSRRFHEIGENVAEKLLSRSDNEKCQNLLAFMVQSDPDLAKNVQLSVFEIDDLEKLDDDEVKTVLKYVDTSSWAPVLQKASSSLQAKIFANMAPSVAKLLNQEMSQLGDVDSNTLSLARQNISQVVTGLAWVGKLDWPKSDLPAAVSEV